MLLKVSLSALARVTAGLANEVAAVMYAPTANGITHVRSREQPHITESNPNVAMNSLNICGAPLRLCRDAETQRQCEHGVSAYNADAATEELGDDVSGSFAPTPPDPKSSTVASGLSFASSVRPFQQ
jgi:hypothetical protein